MQNSVKLPLSGLLTIPGSDNSAPIPCLHTPRERQGLRGDGAAGGAGHSAGAWKKLAEGASSMRRPRTVIGICFCLACAAAGGVARAQGRGGQNWTTSNADAQRTSWMRTDSRISRDSVQKAGAFQLIWKTKLDNQTRQLNSLTPPVLLNTIISYKGFKSLLFIGGSSDNVYSIDYDLNRIFWTRLLSSSPQ